MKIAVRVVKWLIALVVVTAGTLIGVGTLRLSRAVEVAEHPAPEPATSPIEIQEGERLADAFACTECHGADLEGTDFLDGGPFMKLPAPNLTGGRVSARALELAVRHGIGSDGRALVIMPSEAYVAMADDDLAALSGYIATLPDRSTPLMGRSIGPIGRAVATFQAPILQPARRIEHPTRHAATSGGAVGRFGSLCTACHGADYGGQVFTAEQALWAPNLTSHRTGASSWTLEQFSRALRQGQTPDGRTLNSAEMPWKGFSKMTDAEVEEIYGYLRSLPAVDRPRPPDM